MEQLIKKITNYQTGLPRKFAPHEHKRSLWREVRNVRGQVVVELLVAFGLATVLLPAILTGFTSARSGKVQEDQRLAAEAYLKEAVDVVKNVRNLDWANVETNGVYHPLISPDCVSISGSVWKLCPGSETIGDFTRSITISDISPSDPSLKQINVTVSWNNIIPTNVSTIFYITRWKNITSDLTVSGTLINQANGDWCAPSYLTALDLPKSGVANAISAIQGQIAAGTGDNASGVSYANVSVTDPSAPATPSASIVGTFDGFKTNDVFTEQNYAYLATDTNTKEIEIVNLTSLNGGKYSEAGYFDAPGNGNGGSVATNGNVGYMVDGSKLYSFDLSSKTGSRPIVDPDGVALPGTGTKIMIVGQRAYITTSSTTGQLVVANISTPTNLTIKKQISLPAQGGVSLYVNSDGTRAYVVTHYSASQNDIFIVNVDESSAGFGNVLASYTTNGMDPRGVVLVNIPRLIVVGTGGQEYQVYKVNEDELDHCGGMNVDSGINAISTVFTAAQRAYSYIVTGDANSELKIIEGGPGGGGSGGGLTADSPVLDTGHTSYFNRIDVKSLTPTGVSATYQVAVSTDCTTFNFTGNYTTSGGVIPVSINPGRCFKYRVTFSGGTGNTNVSTTVTVNYSP